MCVCKWQPNRRTASWSYARLCDIDTHINSLENISHTQWDSWFSLISSNIATIPYHIPEHTTAFVGFHVFPCLPQERAGCTLREEPPASERARSVYPGCKNKCADTVADILVEKIILRFGMTLVIHTPRVDRTSPLRGRRLLSEAGGASRRVQPVGWE